MKVITPGHRYYIENFEGTAPQAFPCRENAIVITNLETSLLWLEKRTRDRMARNVEGKQIA